MSGATPQPPPAAAAAASLPAPAPINGAGSSAGSAATTAGGRGPTARTPRDATPLQPPAPQDRSAVARRRLDDVLRDVPPEDEQPSPEHEVAAVGNSKQRRKRKGRKAAPASKSETQQPSNAAAGPSRKATRAMARRAAAYDENRVLHRRQHDSDSDEQPLCQRLRLTGSTESTQWPFAHSAPAAAQTLRRPAVLDSPS